jgi:membrane-associated protease RseP (regulator of RpoE activity)
MATAGEPITVFVRPGDAACQSVLAHLDKRGLAYTTRDVLSDPSASAILFGRLGRVVVPVVQIGDRMLAGYDPVQLARFLPAPEDEQGGVSFGAAVRVVTPEIAAAHGMPAAYGVEVGSVRPGSAAEAAGVRPGDVIAGIGGYTLHGGAEQFRRAVAARRPGDTMQLTLWRDGGPVDVAVSFPVEPAPAEA